jgi:hypothetical protein
MSLVHRDAMVVPEARTQGAFVSNLDTGQPVILNADALVREAQPGDSARHFVRPS